MIQIKEVVSKKDKKLFAKYPVMLYKHCPYYVPSLRSDELNTFNPKKNFNLSNNEMKAFLCFKDGKLVGRIAGMVNKKHNELTGKKMIRFSRFDCIDDKEVFQALLSAVEKFGKEQGMEIIHGPWGFNDTDREGMLTYGYDRVSTYATNYNYPYYSEYMKSFGYADESKWIEYAFKTPQELDARVNRLAEMLKKKYEVYDVLDVMSVSEVAKYYCDEFFETYNSAYGALDGFIPVDEGSKKNVLKQFATIINPKYSSILIDKNGKVAAFGILLPSICKTLIKHRGKLFPTGFIGVLSAIKKPKGLEMALIAVRDNYKNSGITTIIMQKIINNIIAAGIDGVESNPMLETNHAILQEWKFLEHEIVKRRQTFQKTISV